MTLRRLIEQISPLYPTWDEQLCRDLMYRFELVPDVRLGSMSRGQRMRARLLTAVAYRPRLLLLDEPFSGLDPMVRGDVIEGMLELAGDEPWSILLATHELTIAERLADRIGFLSLGDLWLDENLDELLSRCRRVRAELDKPPPRGFTPPARCADWQVEGARVSFFETEAGRLQNGKGGVDVEAAYDFLPAVRSISVHEPSLEQIFVALHRQRRLS